MLPGLRFVLATVVLAVSVVIFGLGAAALLRASHDQFANLPAAQAPREQLPRHDQEIRQTTLALLRVEMIAEQVEAAKTQAEVASDAAVVVPVATDAVAPPPAAARVQPDAPAGAETAVRSDTAVPEAPVVAKPETNEVAAVSSVPPAQASDTVAAPPVPVPAAAVTVSEVAPAAPPAETKDDEKKNDTRAAAASLADSAGCVPAAASAQTGSQIAMLIDQALAHAEAAKPAAVALATPAQTKATMVHHRAHRIRIHHVRKNRGHRIKAARAQLLRLAVQQSQPRQPQPTDPFNPYSQQRAVVRR